MPRATGSRAIWRPAAWHPAGTPCTGRPTVRWARPDEDGHDPGPGDRAAQVAGCWWSAPTPIRARSCWSGSSTAFSWAAGSAIAVALAGGLALGLGMSATGRGGEPGGRADHRRRSRRADRGARHGRRVRPAGGAAQPHARSHPGPDGRPAAGLQRHRARPAHAPGPPAPASRTGARPFGRR